MRAVLDFVRENWAAVHNNLLLCQELMQGANLYLKILDPELGVQELVKSVAAALAKVTALIAENSQRQ